MRSYSAGVVLEFGGTVERAGLGRAAPWSSGLSSASTIAASRSLGARERGLRPSRPVSGRTGVTTVMVSCTASNTTTMVGRIEDRVGNADRVGIGRRKLLHQPHHVVAEIAEHAGGHRRQCLGQFDPAFGDQRAQRGERRLGQAREAVGWPRRAVDLGARRRWCAKSGRARARSPNSGRAPRRLRPIRAGSSSAGRRRSSETPKPAFPDRRPAWSRPPALRLVHSARRRRRPAARSAWRNFSCRRRGATPVTPGATRLD